MNLIQLPLVMIRENSVRTGKLREMQASETMRLLKEYRKKCKEIEASIDTVTEEMEYFVKAYYDIMPDDCKKIIELKRNLFNKRYHKAKKYKELVEKHPKLEKTKCFMSEILQLIEMKPIIENKLGEEYERGRSVLWNIWKEEKDMQCSLIHFDENLGIKLAQYLEKEPQSHNMKLKKMDGTLLKLYTRATLKPSPFSTLCRVKMLVNGKGEEKPISVHYEKIIQINYVHIFRLWEYISKMPEVSFKSHVIGFLENSDSRTDLLHKGFQQIYECMRDELKMMEEKQYIFSVGQELLEQWGRFFRTFVEEIYFNGKIQSRLKKESNYVEESVKNLSGYTKFHHNWISRSQFADFFFSEEFYRYRTLVNFFYLLLPSLGFGPREKHLGCYLITRTIEDTKKQEVSKMNVKGTKKKNQVVTVNVFEQQEIIAKAEIIKSNLKASTWRELETKGKFDKNAKLSFVNDDMLILGCDVGSDTHYARAIDTRGRELSKSAFPFSNTLEGFQSLIEEIWQCDRNRIYEANLIVGMFMSDIGKVIGTMEEAIVEDISITISRAFYIDRHTMEGRSVDMERHLDCPICGPGKKGYLCIKNCR